MTSLTKSPAVPGLFRILSLVSLLLFAAPAYADRDDLPKSVRQLIDWETRSNAVSTRSNDPIRLRHYEIPVNEITLDLASNIDPWVRKSLVFTRDGVEYVRWIINPEDTRWHKEIASFLKKRGLDSSPKEYFEAYLTSSRSLIVLDPESGAVFSAKASTNNTGGNWTDKKQPYDDAQQARESSDMISEVQRRMKFEHMVLLEEPAMLGIESVGQAILIRSLGDLPKSENYYLPGFSALHERTGKEIALLNGSRDPAAFWNEHYNKSLARAYAELTAHFGLTYDSPHSQNFLVELDKDMKPTGRIVFRDFVDGYAHREFLTAARQTEFLKGWDSDNIIERQVHAAVGVMHGNEYPRWLDDDIYSEWGRVFYETYEIELSKLTGVPFASLSRSRLDQRGRYFMKDYVINGKAWQRYFDLADCFFGYVKTRSGLDCPEELKAKILPEFRKLAECSVVLGPVRPPVRKAPVGPIRPKNPNTPDSSRRPSAGIR